MRPTDWKPVVALDIDGTLGDYHGHFLSFAEAWTGKRMPKPDEINPGLPLYKHMHISRQTYRECKLAYRQGGMKRSMPVYEGAKELSRAIRKAGAEVWITTTRPYLRLDNIDPDTRHWLRRNGIQYDAVIYGEHKYRDLVRNVGPSRVACVMDDLPELVMQATSLGVDGIIRDQPYNRHFPWHLRAESLPDAQRWITKRLEQWRYENGMR
jgi:hypothetical protein